MQPENSFDKLSKRLAVTVSRRSLLRSLSLAVAGAFLPWTRALADSKRTTSLELEAKIFAGPDMLQLRAAGPVKVRCVAVVANKSSGKLVIGDTYAREGQCPTDIPSYFENSEVTDDLMRQAKFDESKIYDVRQVDGYSRMFETFPVASFYSFVNPDTGKEEYEAYCSTFTYLDPDVHEGDSSRMLMHYKRLPIPEKLTSLDDDVTCGDINYAYENEIKTRKPIALRDFTVDAVPHQASAKRVNATDTYTRNHSGHKSK